MKFENIKVGDDVLVHVEEQGLSIFSNRKRFLVPAKVERVTKTQFVAGGKRYYKERGDEIGTNLNMAFFPDEDGREDQTKQRMEYRARIQLVLRASNAVHKVDLIKWSDNDLEALLRLTSKAGSG